MPSLTTVTLTKGRAFKYRKTVHTKSFSSSSRSSLDITPALQQYLQFIVSSTHDSISPACPLVARSMYCSEYTKSIPNNGITWIAGKSKELQSIAISTNPNGSLSCLYYIRTRLERSPFVFAVSTIHWIPCKKHSRDILKSLSKASRFHPIPISPTVLGMPSFYLQPHLLYSSLPI